NKLPIANTWAKELLEEIDIYSLFLLTVWTTSLHKPTQPVSSGGRAEETKQTTQELRCANNMTENNPARLFKFLGPTEIFTGTTSIDPVHWLRHLERIRMGAALSDTEIVLVAATHMKGNAARWWAVNEDNITTWDNFKKQFKKQFASEQFEEIWWREIETTNQTTNQSVTDLALKLQELLGLVKVTDEGQKIRTLLRALRPETAYQIEKMGVPDKWDDLVNRASKLQYVQDKYEKPSSYSQPARSQRSQPHSDDASSIHGALSDLVREFKALKIHLVDSRKPRRTFTCFECGQEGHRRPECPNLQETSQGKGLGHQ
ncbi:hypothetical protein INT47_009224, partial [Mucor saturninus]